MERLGFGTADFQSLVFAKGSFDASSHVPSHGLVNEPILHCSYLFAYSSAYLVVLRHEEVCPLGLKSFDG